jgi:hypothetical protein
MFDMADTFPTISPIVSFTGLIIGSGHNLLHDDIMLGNDQQKCCGFIQLSTFITPGTPSKTPFKGFHPFQVFVIFPIYANPWLLLCKRMVEKQETHFQPNTFFSCTGKVAGFLDHHIMVHPPQFTQDHVFIVVPETWKFHDKTGKDSITTSPSATTPAKQPSTTPSGRAKFRLLPKPTTQRPTTPMTTTSPSIEQVSHTEPANLTPSC